jgi:hypothetical protein
MGAHRGLHDSKLRCPSRAQHQGTRWGAWPNASVLTAREGPRVTGCDLVTRGGWPRRDNPWEAWGRDARLRVTNPTDGPGTWVIVDEPGEEHFCSPGTRVLR